MKLRYFVMILMVFTVLVLSAQDREIWVNQDFSSATFPPTGWTISAQAANWSRVQGAAAGGTAPEARMNWSPQFNGSTYLISPVFDTTGETTVYVDFDHFVDWYATPFTIGLATRSNNGAWNVAFSQNPSANVGPERKTVAITNADVGSSTFQFALYFSGSSYNIDYWYIDNIKLYTPFPNDLAITSIPGAEHYEAGTQITPSCMIKNVGLSQLTATVSLDIYQHETLVQSYPDQFSQILAVGAEATATFPVFTPSVSNELYRFVYHVSSLEDVVDGDLTNNMKEKAINTWTTAKQNVLLEIGTGGWCQYCPGAAMAADHFVEENYNVAVIENHNGDPYESDISNGRNAYYGISGFPTGIFDGLLSYVGGSNTTSIFPSYLPLYEQRQDIKTPLSLALFGTHDVLDYDVIVHVNKLANLAYSNLVLHLAVTESNIQYVWQGQSELNFVNRGMFPGLDGTGIDLLNAPIGIMEVPISFSLGQSWITSECELIAFIQNLDNKEVIQAYKIALNDLPEPVSTSDLVAPSIQHQLQHIFPNPFSAESNIAYKMASESPVSIAIYNQKGQLVKSLVNEAKSAGEYSTKWNGTDENGKKVANGIYFVKMNAGSYSTSAKMILMK